MIAPPQEEFMAGRRHHWNALEELIGTSLRKQAPGALAEWEGFRAKRVREIVADWLDGLGVGRNS